MSDSKSAPAPEGTVTNANNRAPPTLSPRGLDVQGPNPNTAASEASLAEAELALNTAVSRYKISKTEQRLNKIGDAADVVNSIKSGAENTWSEVQPVASAIQSTSSLRAIEEKLYDFTDGIPVLMNALDEIGKIHPFVQAAVLAFKAVYKLEVARRESDKRIRLLFVEMKDMMSVLLRLKNIGNISDASKARLRDLSDLTANDIKACANACDTYSKKKLVVKLVKSPLWENRFATFCEVFATRRADFEFELAMHTAEIGNESYTKIYLTEMLSRDIQAKVNLMLLAFQTFLSPEQSEMKRSLLQITSAEGVLDETKSEQMRQLLKDKPALVLTEGRANVKAGDASKTTSKNDADEAPVDSKTQGSLSSKSSAKSDVDDAVKELKESTKDTRNDEEKNGKIFDVKFSMQKRQIIDEMERVVVRESDRVISEVKAGPHDRVVDKDMYAIWVEMGWKGNVKARHFVLALRDYYQERAAVRAEGKTDITTESTVSEGQDDWALPYINVPYLQPILEAIDDDASGFITIAEINKFTASRPKDWSLRRWIAYWAIGFYANVYAETNKIRELFNKMFGLLPKILPENRPHVQVYLEDVWKRVYIKISSLNALNIPNDIEGRFRDYVEDEEKRLKERLEEIRFDIDQLDALGLVTGSGRIEKHYFTLTRLVLERHLQTFRICTKKIVNEEELRDAQDTLLWINDAFIFRYDDLKTIFTNQHLDLGQQFKQFAFGIFEYYNQSSLLWADAIKTLSFEDAIDNEPDDKQLKDEDVLIHPEPDDLDIDYPPFQEAEDCGPSISEDHSMSAHPIEGTWSDVEYTSIESKTSADYMLSYTFEADLSSEDDLAFRGSGTTYIGSPYTMNGKCDRTDHENIYNVSFRWFLDSNVERVFYYSGQLDASSGSVTGTYGLNEDHNLNTWIFVLKRTPSTILRFRPSPFSFSENKARALWRYATSAILDQVRRRLWTWSYFRERRDLRRQFLRLSIRSAGHGPPLSDDDELDFWRVRQLLTVRDARYLNKLLNRVKRTVSFESSFLCDNCRESLHGERIVCLDCESTSGILSTVEFCTSQNCCETEIKRDDLEKPHVPSHDLMQLRQVLLHRRFLTTFADAKKMIQAGAEKFFASRDDKEEASRNEALADAPAKAADSESTASKPNGKEVAERDNAPSNSSAKMPASTASDQHLQCSVCQRVLQRPCWYCMDCANYDPPVDTFICTDCNAKGWFTIERHAEDYKGKIPIARYVEDHKAGPCTNIHYNDHSLVKLRHITEKDKDVDKPSVEQSVIALNDRLSQVEENIEAIKEANRAMMERQVRVEEMLKTLLERLPRGST